MQRIKTGLLWLIASSGLMLLLAILQVGLSGLPNYFEGGVGVFSILLPPFFLAGFTLRPLVQRESHGRARWLLNLIVTASISYALYVVPLLIAALPLCAISPPYDGCPYYACLATASSYLLLVYAPLVAALTLLLRLTGVLVIKAVSQLKPRARNF